MTHSERYNSTAEGANSLRPNDRQQILLDDLRVEIERLADAVERQNELLDRQQAGDHSTAEVDR